MWYKIQMKKWTIILLTFFAASLALICLCCCKTNKANAVYSVKFYVDGSLYNEISVKYGSPLNFPEIENTEDNDNVFIGWFTSSNYDKWFTAETVTKNINVYGYWSSYEDSLISVKYYNDGEIVKDYQICKGTYIENYQLPETESGYSLDKWLVDGKPYDFNIKPLQDIELHALLKPTEYSVEFISLGEVISTQTYTVENRKIIEPACPTHEHYHPGKWESYELTKGNIQINAIYEPVNYSVEYIDGGGNVLAKIDYNITNYKEVVPPEPTFVPGCYSYWDELECGMTVIHLKVAILDYTIEYYVNDKLVASYETTILDFHKLEEPEIPQIAGYEAYWEDFKLQLETNIKVHAVYDLITYHVNFVADNKVVDVLEYNVENTEIETPEVPAKSGYTAKWEEFNLEIGDITVTAEYTPIDYAANFVIIDELIETETKLAYTTTFNAENMNINFPSENDYPFVDGCSVKWEKTVLSFNDVTIKGYYYDVDYTYLNFVQVKQCDENRNITEHYFYVSGISSSGYDEKVSKIIIPEKYHNVPVAYIDKKAFYNNKFIRTVEIYGIETINEYAFACCYSLQSVKMFNGIKTIENNAFGGSSNLTKIDIPETVEQIGEFAFTDTALVRVTLPANLNKLSENLFCDCSELKEITIPDSVTEISYCAFSGCLNLTNVTIGSNVEIIRDSAFAYCYSLKEITIPEKVKFIESNAFLDCTSLTSFNISDTNSDWYLFKNNDYSKKILIPKSMLVNGNDLADNLKLIPDWGMYKETTENSALQIF